MLNMDANIMAMTLIDVTNLVDARTFAICATIVAAGSEIIGLLPIRSNTWVQLILQALRAVFPKR